MNCVDPIDHQPYRDMEKQTLRGAYARAIKTKVPGKGRRGERA